MSLISAFFLKKIVNTVYLITKKMNTFLVISSDINIV